MSLRINSKLPVNLDAMSSLIWIPKLYCYKAVNPPFHMLYWERKRHFVRSLFLEFPVFSPVLPVVFFFDFVFLLGFLWFSILKFETWTFEKLNILWHIALNASDEFHCCPSSFVSALYLNCHCSISKWACRFFSEYNSQLKYFNVYLDPFFQNHKKNNNFFFLFLPFMINQHQSLFASTLRKPVLSEPVMWGRESHRRSQFGWSALSQHWIS